MVLHSSLPACANSSTSGLSPGLLGAVKPDAPRNTIDLSKAVFGSALRWTVPSCSWSKSAGSRSKGFHQHARAAIELPQLDMGTQDQIPPISTILQYLIPPPEPSTYADEANSILTHLQSSWGIKPNPIMDIYKTTAVQCSMHVHPRSTSADRLAAISLFYWVLYMLDEACFDISDSRFVAVAEDFGIDSSMRHDRSRMRSFWKRLKGLFTATELPCESIPVEKAVWDTGKLMRSLAVSETWFLSFVEAVEIYAASSFELHFCGASEVTSHEELEEYIDTRVRNAAMHAVCSAAELGTGKYLSPEARNHPKIQRLRHLCNRYCTLQNDLCSYHKEVYVDQETAGNVIQVMMNLDNLSFEQAVQRLMDIMVADSQEFLKLEQDSQVAEMTANDEGLRACILGLKDVMSGTFEYHHKSIRYLTVDNPIPEMRKVA